MGKSSTNVFFALIAMVQVIVYNFGNLSFESTTINLLTLVVFCLCYNLGIQKED